MDEGRVLTCVCMLGYWMWDAVPIWFLYASVLDAGCCVDLVPVCFGIGCGVLCRFIFLGIRPAALLVMDCFEAVFCMLRCWLWDAVPIWFLYSSVLDVERCADLFLYIVFFWALGRMYIRFYCLLSAVEFSAGDVAAVWAAVEEV